MTTTHPAPRIPWNLGRIVGPKPPLKPKHIWAIRTRLQHQGQVLAPAGPSDKLFTSDAERFAQAMPARAGRK